MRVSPRGICSQRLPHAELKDGAAEIDALHLRCGSPSDQIRAFTNALYRGIDPTRKFRILAQIGQRKFGAESFISFGFGFRKREPAEAAICCANNHPAKRRARRRVPNLFALAALGKALRRHAELVRFIGAAAGAEARVVNGIGHGASLLERAAHSRCTQCALVRERADAHLALEEPLHGERAQVGHAAQLFKTHAAVEMRLNVATNLVQRANPRSGARRRRRTAALAGAKAGGLCLGRGAEEAHIGTQRAAARARGPAEDARGRHCVEEVRLRVACGELFPREVCPRSINLGVRGIDGRGFCGLRHDDPGHRGNGGELGCDFGSSAHENDSRRSPFRAHSDSCAQFRFRRESAIAAKLCSTTGLHLALTQ